MGRLIIFLAALILSLSVNANFLGDRASCLSLSMVASDVADLRDSGVDWATFQPWIQASLDNAKLNPDSFIKDDGDVAFVLKWFKHIFDHPNLSSEGAQMLVESKCMSKTV